MACYRAQRLGRAERAIGAALLVPVLTSVAAARLDAQIAPAADSSARTTVVIAGLQYRAGWLHRFFLGRYYRDLWTTPIQAEVLNLQTLAGGLRPVSRGGGFQTRSLRFEAPDGRRFTFRSVDKDPAALLPPALRETIAASVVRDQTSSQHPAGPLVVGPLLGAAGVLHTDPRFVVLPDDSALGPHRAEFAGMLGTFEELPQEPRGARPGFEGVRRIINSDQLAALLAADPRETVDARAFLAARLLDVFVGDWDRHRGQWRWARRGDDPWVPWEPIPEDRDQAFVKLDGLLLAFARNTHPQLVDFGPEYAYMPGQTWNGRDLDRQLLNELERPVWDSTARALQERLTDAVIDSTVARMPREYFRLNGAELAATLKRRRDLLPDAARRFYELLASEVDIHLTNAPDLLEVERLTSGHVVVTASGARAADGAEPASPYYHRRFDPRETDEIRLYLRAGDDRVVVREDGEHAITLRVVGGSGDDELLDSSSAGGLRFYDAEGRDRAWGRGVRLDRRPWIWDSAQSGSVPPRDWGSWWRPVIWMSGSPDIGLLVGGGVARDRFGFRRRPYRFREVVRGAYSTGAQTGRVEYTRQDRRLNSGTYSSFRARASGIEILRFYGFGNETAAPGPASFYKVERQQFSLEGDLVVPVASHLAASVGQTMSYSHTGPQTRFIATVNPYGVGDYWQLGWRAGLRFDSRDQPAAASRGLFANVEGSVFPGGVLDVETAFAVIQGEAATYLTASAPTQPTLALRAGGRKLWGPYPFHEAAFIGGSTTVRGWQRERFAGDASLYGNAELRLFLTRFFIVLPGEAGLFALADAGRVYADGDSSDRWHTAVGGGLWFAYLSRANTISVALAQSAERTGVYVRAGFMF